jgi:hypothetical protein
MRFVLLVIVLAGCTHAFGPRPYREPTAQSVIAYLDGLRSRVSSLKAETRTDAWIGNDRANVEVLILARWGGKLRYMAMNPGRSAMAADLASDGQEICFIDANNDCGGCGPATAENVGQLVRVQMPPDAVVTAMFGGTPLIDATEVGLTWDAQRGHEILVLEGGGLVQKVVLEGRNHSWDVLMSQVTDDEGKLIWRISHKGFHAVIGQHGTLRLPGKSHFEQPARNGQPANDVIIDWRKQTLDEDLPDAKFQLAVDPQLRDCGQATPPPPASP